MKRVTVNLDDETYRLARIRAAELNTSVSALMRDYLTKLVKAREVLKETGCDEKLLSMKWGKTFNSKAEYEEHIRKLDETIERLRKKHPNFSASENLSREELYDRARTRPSSFPTDENPEDDG